MRNFRFVILLLLCFPIFCRGQSSRVDYRLDNELFRRGLIDRGLDDWLAIYDRQHPPLSDLDLLAGQIGGAWLKYRRAQDVHQREKALDELLDLELDRFESYPDHPLSANWQIRYSADLLNEKCSAFTFVKLLNLSLPAAEKKQFAGYLQKIQSHLEKSIHVLNTRIAKFRNLDDASLSAINRQGLPELYYSAQIRAEILRGWCLYYEAKLLKDRSAGQVRILYQLDKLLTTITEKESNPGMKLLQGSVAMMLGNYSRAEILLRGAAKNLPERNVIFAKIDQVLSAYSENKLQIANDFLKQAERLKLIYHSDPRRYELIDLSILLLQGRVALKQLSPQELCSRDIRNRIWKKLTRVIIAKPEFGALVFPEIVHSDSSCPQENCADIELYAQGIEANASGKVPLAESKLRHLLARKNINPALSASAALILSGKLEKQGKLAEALAVLQSDLSRKKTADTCKLLAACARVSWRSLREEPTQEKRKVFLSAANRLLNTCPESPSADRFKLLMADQLAMQGKYNQAIQWTEQVVPSSDMYIRSKASKVLILAKEFRESPEDSAIRSSLAGQIERECSDMLVVASSGQKDAKDVSSWQLSREQTDVLAGAILSCVNVLSSRKINRQKEANALMRRYKPILKRYEKTSKSGYLVQINTLIRAGSNGSLSRAISQASHLIVAKTLPRKQAVMVSVNLLSVLHQKIIMQSDILSPPTDLAKESFTFAEIADKNLAGNNVIRTLYAIIAGDSGRYELAKKIMKKLPDTPSRYPVDIALLRSRISFADKDYLSSAKGAMNILQQTSPSDIRYWQALIINLRSHLHLGSDHSQIASAVIVRKEQYPDMGNSATRRELMKILKEAGVKGGTTKSE